MNDLTPRQAHILKAIIEEYIKTAEPIGSETLEKKYSLGVSPATIRNEMASLTLTGYLKQPHTSAGRIPTSRAFRFYVQQLMEEQKLTVAEEVKARQRIEDAKADVSHLMQEATRALAQETKTLSVGAIEGDDALWHSGHANLLEMPEFYNIDVTSHVLALLEEAQKMHELLFNKGVGDLTVLFGEELGWPYFEPVGIITTRFQMGSRNGCLAVIGSARLSYEHVIPRIRYFGGLMSEIAKGL